MDDEAAPTKRYFELSIVEMGVVTAIITSMIALLLPAVFTAHQAHHPPPRAHWFELWLASQPVLPLLLFPVVCTLTVVGGLLALRAVLPASYKKHLPWKSVQPQVKVEDLPKYHWDSPANVVTLLSPLALVLIVFGGSHLRADRRQRRPIITWEGPLGPFAEVVLWTGIWAAIVVILITGFSLIRCETRCNQRAFGAAMLAFIALFCTMIVMLAAYED